MFKKNRMLWGENLNRVQSRHRIAKTCKFSPDRRTIVLKWFFLAYWHTLHFTHVALPESVLNQLFVGTPHDLLTSKFFLQHNKVLWVAQTETIETRLKKRGIKATKMYQSAMALVLSERFRTCVYLGRALEPHHRQCMAWGPVDGAHVK